MFEQSGNWCFRFLIEILLPDFFPFTFIIMNLTQTFYFYRFDHSINHRYQQRERRYTISLESHPNLDSSQ